MRSIFLLITCLLFQTSSRAQCLDAPRTHGRLQWSEPAKIVAPNRAWQVEVQPVLTAEENETPVLLSACGKSESWPLIVLRRSADVYWGPTSTNLLIVNKPTADDYTVVLFDVDAVSEGKQPKEPDAIDAEIKRVLFEQLGKSRHVEFYLPRFVSWKDDVLVLAVGGTTSAGRNGPMTPYCLGFMIDSRKLRVQKVVSSASLKTRFKVGCQVSP